MGYLEPISPIGFEEEETCTSGYGHTAFSVSKVSENRSGIGINNRSNQRIYSLQHSDTVRVLRGLILVPYKVQSIYILSLRIFSKLYASSESYSVKIILTVLTAQCSEALDILRNRQLKLAKRYLLQTLVSATF